MCVDTKIHFWFSIPCFCMTCICFISKILVYCWTAEYVWYELSIVLPVLLSCGSHAKAVQDCDKWWVKLTRQGEGQGLRERESIWLTLWDSGTPVERRASSTYQRIQINSLYLQPWCPTFNGGRCVGQAEWTFGKVIWRTTQDDGVMESKSGVACTNQLANHAPLTSFARNCKTNLS